MNYAAVDFHIVIVQGLSLMHAVVCAIQLAQRF